MQLVKFRDVVDVVVRERADGTSWKSISQSMHIIDQDGETMGVFQVDVKTEAGVRPGIYRLTESCWEAGEYGRPQLNRDISTKARFMGATFQEVIDGKPKAATPPAKASS